MSDTRSHTKSKAMITSTSYLLATIDELRKTNNSLAIGYEARGREIETLKRARAAPASPHDGRSNEWARYLRELADAQVKQQIAVNLRQAAEEIERLQSVFDEASAEACLSHNAPCFCKYCREPNDAGRPCGCRTDIAGAAQCEERSGFPGSYCLLERQREEAQSDEQVSK